MSDNIELPVVSFDEESLEESKVQLLAPRHQRFVHLYLSGNYTIKQIATTMNVADTTIRSWLKNPKIRDIVEDVQKEDDDIVRQGIKALRLKALYRMSDLINSKVDSIAYQAARDVLDRTGHKAPTKQEVTVEVYTFEQQIKEIMDKATAYETNYEVIDEE